MVTKNVVDFLSSHGQEELRDRGILRGTTNQLKGTSIDPLIQLMREEGVDRLDYPDLGWHLDAAGTFANRSSAERIKQGNISDLVNRGNVFNYMNTRLNPFYEPSQASTKDEEEIEQAEEITFGLERDLQTALRGNIEQLEPGLTIVDGGVERSCQGGRIDITAEDASGALVVIELKAGTAMPESIAQILAYMASLGTEENKPVRGILVAGDFNARVVLAAQAVPDLQLKKYSFSFSFRDM